MRARQKARTYAAFDGKLSLVESRLFGFECLEPAPITKAQNRAVLYSNDTQDQMKQNAVNKNKSMQMRQWLVID